MRKTSILSLALVGACLLYSSIALPARSYDGDGDGIDDNLEQSLAEAFLPEIHYHSDEQCGGPTPGQVLYRLRHPTKFGVPNHDYIVINYVRLYADDCAPMAHQGDNEPFMVFLQKINGDWAFASLAATAHTNAWPVEVRTGSHDSVMWVGKNKHGGFAEIGECESNPWPFTSDYCDWDGPTMAHWLYNVGEPSTWLLNDLGLINGWWSGQYVWNDYDGFLGAGSIRDALFTTNFKSMTPVPGLQACYASCQLAAKQCLSYESFEYCSSEQAICNTTCDIEHLRWDQ